MASVLGDTLRRFCVEIGWSYAVFWRVVGTQEQRYLIWEEGYCGRMRGGISGFEAMDLLIKEKGLLRGSRYEERISELGRPTEDKIYMLVHKRMAGQTHALGDGVIGKAASTGNHQWILQGNFNLSSAVSKDMVEMNQQLMAGIQTIAVIPVLPRGVLQLGSTQLIFEEIGFVNYVRHLFMQPRSMARSHLYDASGTVFNHKSQLPANMQPSISQYGDTSSNVNTLLSRSCHGRDLQLFGDYSRFANKASPVFTSSSLDKMTTRSQQMPLNNNINAKKIMPFNNSSHSTCHVINPNLFSNILGHPGTFSASNSSIMEKTLPHQSVYESCCQPASTNGSLFSSHLKSCENHFETYSEAAHESSDSQETIVDGPKLLRCNYESKLSVSRKDSEAALSFGIRDSFNEMGNIGSTCSLSNDIMECVKSNISPSNQVSQVLSLTDDLDRVCMFSSYFSQTHSSSTGKKSMTVSSVDKEKDEDEIYQAVDKLTTVADNQRSIERLHHSINHGDQFDTYLVSPTKRDLYGSSAVSNGNDSVAVLNTSISPPSSIKININVQQQYSESNLFDLFDLDRASNANYSTWDDSLTDLNSAGFCGLSASLPASINQSGADTFGDVLNDEISCSGGLFPESGSDQLLEAIVSHVKPTVNLISVDNAFYDTGSTKTSNLLHSSIPQCNVVDLSEQLPGNFEGLSSISTQSQTVDANSLKSECSIDRSEGVSSLGNDSSKSQISLWVGKARNLNRDRSSAAICKRVDDVGKSNKKRSRIGENPRPRPKDRQMIQDRVKELREIVPNGAKMSIDALLEKTIKHMLFLQSVTKHADKLKEAGKKPKILGGEEGQVLHKDNFLGGGGGGGGATWAFEVGSQSVVCPIIVENLSTPRHMLVEMICEKRGLFLEIADLIRGLGFTILKGVMESRNDKVWAQFAVEANRDVTRMEVFLSLVHLLEPTGRDAAALEGGIHYCKKPQNLFHQLTGAADCV